MEDLITHLVSPLLKHPDALSLQEVEGRSVIEFEMVVHPDDVETFSGENSRTIRAVRSLVSAAAGRRKATVTLVDEHAADGAEE